MAQIERTPNVTAERIQRTLRWLMANDLIQPKGRAV